MSGIEDVQKRELRLLGHTKWRHNDILGRCSFQKIRLLRLRGNRWEMWLDVKVEQNIRYSKLLGSCYDSSYRCNCDNNDNSVMTQDEGYLNEKSKLPVREIKFGDMGDSGESGWHTLGKLECSGWLASAIFLDLYSMNIVISKSNTINICLG